MPRRHHADAGARPSAGGMRPDVRPDVANADEPRSDRPQRRLDRNAGRVGAGAKSEEQMAGIDGAEVHVVGQVQHLRTRDHRVADVDAVSRHDAAGAGEGLELLGDGALGVRAGGDVHVGVETVDGDLGVALQRGDRHLDLIAVEAKPL